MKEDELVLCVVEKVTNTVTFVRLPDGREGTIISSEIAPGRIKFMRQYVLPNKRVVCKVLKDTQDHVHLSLRRVNAKERKEVMQKFKQEQALLVALKQIFGEDGEAIKQKILNDFDTLGDFVNSTRQDSSILEKYVPKKKIDDLKKVVDKRRKKYEIKKTVSISCLEGDGIKRIKSVFSITEEGLEFRYLSSGEVVLKYIVDDFKIGKKKIMEIEKHLEKTAKENKCEIHISDKR